MVRGAGWISAGVLACVLMSCTACAESASPAVGVSAEDLLGRWIAVDQGEPVAFELREGGIVVAEDWPMSVWCEPAQPEVRALPTVAGAWSAGYGDSAISFSLAAPCNAMPALFAYENTQDRLELWYFAPGTDLDSVPDPTIVFRRAE